MTSPEKIEGLLNRFGQTISDLPKANDYKYDRSLVRSIISAEICVDDWYNPDHSYDFYAHAYPAYICHQSDVIERLVAALKNAEKVASCDFCRKHEDKCSSSSKFECEGFELEEQDV